MQVSQIETKCRERERESYLQVFFKIDVLKIWEKYQENRNVPKFSEELFLYNISGQLFLNLLKNFHSSYHLFSYFYMKTRERLDGGKANSEN